MKKRTITYVTALVLLAMAMAPHALAAQARHRVALNVPVLGWYTGGNSELRATNLTGYGRAGMNLVVASYQGNVALHTFLDRARNAGVHVLVSPDDGWVRKGDWASLTAFVQEFKDDPAVYGWYLYDEPDFNHLPAPQLVRAYQAVKSVDRSHPVAVVFTLGQCRFGKHLDRRYLKGFDLLMFDDYPFYTFVKSHTESMASLREFRDTTKHCVHTARHFHKLGPLMVAQGFGNGVKDGPFMYRDPTFGEQKAMFHDAVTAGARGILYFNDDQADHTVKSGIRTIVSSWYRSLPARYHPQVVVIPAPTQSAEISSWHCPPELRQAQGCAN